MPVVNENDATATDEITFGDNDALAAQVAVLVRARLLVLLTEVEGVYSRAPGTPGAELISEGELAHEAEIGVRDRARAAAGWAARWSPLRWRPRAGIPTVIAGGAGDDVLGPILAGEARGTRFTAGRAGRFRVQALASLRQARRRAAARRRGREAALVDKGASLLGVGVVRCEGRFEPGAAVELVGPDGVAFGKGIAGAGAERARGPAARPRGRAPRQAGALLRRSPSSRTSTGTRPRSRPSSTRSSASRPT